MKNSNYREIQMLLFTPSTHNEMDNLMDYIDTTDNEIQIRLELTTKLKDLAEQMLDKKYKDVECLQKEFDITYATLKALRKNEY